jgi:hypothetical protein
LNVRNDDVVMGGLHDRYCSRDHYVALERSALVLER